MQSVTVNSHERLQHVVVTDSHALVADEPLPEGDNLGPNPYELLLAALGACTAMTLRPYADRKAWDVRAVRVELTHERVHARDCAECEQAGSFRIDLMRRHILVTGTLDETQAERLLQIAERCPVHRTLKGGPTIVTELAVAAG